MPTYDYDCPSCGAFDALRSLAQRDEPATCPRCSSASPRVLSGAPRLAVRGGGAPSDGGAGGYSRLRHASGCGCCSPRPRAPAPCN